MPAPMPMPACLLAHLRACTLACALVCVLACTLACLLSCGFHACLVPLTPLFGSSKPAPSYLSPPQVIFELFLLVHRLRKTSKLDRSSSC
eukprot:8956262-Pyramimonas_sp.AAC.1